MANHFENPSIEAYKAQLKQKAIQFAKSGAVWAIIIIAAWLIWKSDPFGIISGISKFAHDLKAQVGFSAIGVAVALVVVGILTKAQTVRRIVLPFMDELIIASQVWRVSIGWPPEDKVLKSLDMTKEEFIQKYKNHEFNTGAGLLLAGLAVVTAVMILAVFTLIAHLATPLG